VTLRIKAGRSRQSKHNNVVLNNAHIVDDDSNHGITLLVISSSEGNGHLILNFALLGLDRADLRVKNGIPNFGVPTWSENVGA
jgi:hypothetical protein